jgi:hypothetical protein
MKYVCLLLCLFYIFVEDSLQLAVNKNKISILNRHEKVYKDMAILELAPRLVVIMQEGKKIMNNLQRKNLRAGQTLILI